MKIVKYKKIKNKYRVYFEDESSIDLYDNIILKYSLLLKKQIDNKELEQIKIDNKNEDIYYICLKYISVKMRTKREIISYLKRKNYTSNEIDGIIERLEKDNLINEDEYTKSFIIDKFNLTNDGPNKIKRDLINEGINISLIEKQLEIISKNDIYEKLNRLVDKKIISLKKYGGEILKYKLISYFINLGYDKEIIDEIIINKNLVNNNQGIEEYKKLYTKYSKKYEGYELESIIKQKLYQKGFDYNEIKRNID